MRIVTSTEHVGTQCAGILKILDTIQAAGYDSVDFNANNYCYPGLRYGDTPFFSDDWRDWIADVRAHADELGLRFVQSHNLIFNYFQPGEQTALLNKMVLRSIEACAMLGATHTVVHPVTPVGALPTDTARCLEMNAAYYHTCARFAREFGVTVLTENMMSHRGASGSIDWQYGDAPYDLVRLIDTVNEPNLALCFDTGHAHYMGNDVYESMMLFGKRIQGLHIHDNNRSDDQHLVMYSGSLDWERFIDGVVDCGYSGHFTLESFRSTIRLPLALKTGMMREILEISRYMVARIEQKRREKQGIAGV